MYRLTFQTSNMTLDGLTDIYDRSREMVRSDLVEKEAGPKAYFAHVNRWPSDLDFWDANSSRMRSNWIARGLSVCQRTPVSRSKGANRTHGISMLEGVGGYEATKAYGIARREGLSHRKSKVAFDATERKGRHASISRPPPASLPASHHRISPFARHIVRVVIYGYLGYRSRLLSSL